MLCVEHKTLTCFLVFKRRPLWKQLCHDTETGWGWRERAAGVVFDTQCFVATWRQNTRMWVKAMTAVTRTTVPNEPLSSFEAHYGPVGTFVEVWRSNRFLAEQASGNMGIVVNLECTLSFITQSFSVSPPISSTVVMSPSSVCTNGLSPLFDECFCGFLLCSMTMWCWKLSPHGP